MYFLTRQPLRESTGVTGKDVNKTLIGFLTQCGCTECGNVSSRMSDPSDLLSNLCSPTVVGDVQTIVYILSSCHMFDKMFRHSA